MSRRRDRNRGGERERPISSVIYCLRPPPPESEPIRKNFSDRSLSRRERNPHQSPPTSDLSLEPLNETPPRSNRRRRSSSPSPSKTSGWSDLSHQPNSELWCDRFKPSDPSELTIHPKKLDLIKSWLKDALTGSNSVSRYRRLIVLSGPAGCGKSTTIRTLAHSITHSRSELEHSDKLPLHPKLGGSSVGYEILEWRNGEGGDLDYSRVNEFSLWLARASFGSTLLFNDENGGSSINDRPENNRPRLLLVDELPNLYHSETLESFCGALRNHLNNPRPSTPPLALIISESSLTRGSEGADDALSGAYSGSFNTINPSEQSGLNVRNVLPVDVLNHPACFHLKLNPINNTIMKRMVNRLVDQEISGWKGSKLKLKRLSPGAIERILMASMGDVRSVLNNLQLVYETSGSDESVETGGSKQTEKKRKKKADVISLNAISSIGFRDESLIIFHCLGKVLYNKRWGDDLIEDRKDKRDRGSSPDRLPDYLKDFERRQLKTDIEGLYSEMTAPIDHFVIFLHQNYVNFVDIIEESENVLEYLSNSDLFEGVFDQRWSLKSLRSLYQFHVAVRGMMLCLPSPVKRKSQKLLGGEYFERRKDQSKKFRELEDFKGRLKVEPVKGSSRFRGEVVKDEDLSPALNFLTFDKLAVEVLPYLSMIDKSKSFKGEFESIVNQIGSIDSLKSKNSNFKTRGLELSPSGGDFYAEVEEGEEGGERISQEDKSWRSKNIALDQDSSEGNLDEDGSEKNWFEEEDGGDDIEDF
ncbi:Rad17 cell cycle checkpoint protein-domain-containing protein [Phakopsora pachyrhizi]|uniref:Rad17 cell cycle checkpoint protein-domain-containing protein n=1 Tax=Phakopsora pachyrhizi TaxID=170000 RepID=A0AAV0ASN5_PHAPC|nr:Rad17 cell cycle checkpoint protein-domain-containing protein [Phakopsora pachyrhizi]